ncbi:MAG: hypothetical protein J6586_11835 [Snodgrassella sp.]|nr:hypothetical protein [Snodgrassella sp.]
MIFQLRSPLPFIASYSVPSRPVIKQCLAFAQISLPQEAGDSATVWPPIKHSPHFAILIQLSY